MNDLANYKNSMDNAVASVMRPVIAFGSYPASKDGKPAPVLWKILEEKDGRALLISEMCIDAEPYDERDVVATWESCSLRRYLNETVLNKMFSEEEQKVLLEVRNSNPDNTFFHAKGGEPSAGGADTTDMMFLLSAEEAEKYFNGRNAAARATDHALEKLPGGDDMNVSYWLRGPGMRGNLAVYVRPDGRVENTGYHTGSRDFAIRPAIMVDTSSPEFVRLARQRMREETERPQFVRQENSSVDIRKYKKASVIAGIIGIILTALAFIVLKTCEGTLPLYLLLCAAGFICGLFGFIKGLHCVDEAVPGIILSVIAMLSGIFFLAPVLYNKISYIWDLSEYF